MLFSGSVTVEQRARLSSTDARIDSITFSDEEVAADFLTQARLPSVGGATCAASGTVFVMLDRPSPL